MPERTSYLLRSLRILVTPIFCLACINVAALSWIGSYEIRLGSAHISAHGLFKPILMMNICFILVLMACGSSGGRGLASARENLSLRDRLFWAVGTAAFTLALYSASFQINLSHQDWTHRHISAGIRSLQDGWLLFTSRQADGFYRPLAFLSLWVDFRLFGNWYPGYHIQSVVLHVLNSLLVTWLARELKLERAEPFWAGLIFSAAAVNFEPVLWPATRFDLLATAFTLLAFILAVRYFRSPAMWTWELAFSHLCFVLGILNKESSYCLPLLVCLIICSYNLWFLPHPAPRKWLAYFALSTGIILTMAAIRIAVYGNLGGYASAAGPGSPHFVFGLKAIASLLRVLPLSIFGVNTTVSAPRWLPVLLTVFVVFLFFVGFAGRGCFRRREYLLAACTLIASIPVINIAGWIGSSMQHSRYLYLPGIFAILMMVSVLSQAKHSRFFLASFLLVNAAGVLANLSSYKNTLARVESIAESVRLEYLRGPQIPSICLVALPEHTDGIFYFGSELTERIQNKIPQAQVIRLKSTGTEEVRAPASIYEWSSSEHTLIHRQPQ
jgi:hypothetical protein